MVRLNLHKKMLTTLLLSGCSLLLMPVSVLSADECYSKARAHCNQCNHCKQQCKARTQCKTCQAPERPANDLFYNYYSRANCGTVPAQLYVSPVPTPPVIGHTYITYQPLMPHEFLYKHHRTYHKFYNGGRGLNRTAVSWHGTPLRTFATDVVHALRIPR